MAINVLRRFWNIVLFRLWLYGGTSNGCNQNQYLNIATLICNISNDNSSLHMLTALIWMVEVCLTCVSMRIHMSFSFVCTMFLVCLLCQFLPNSLLNLSHFKFSFIREPYFSGLVNVRSWASKQPYWALLHYWQDFF